MRFPKFASFFSVQVLLVAMALAQEAGSDNLRRQTFDQDPGWQGHNNRLARELPPVKVKQDFGYDPKGKRIGGVIQPAREPAYYAKQISELTLEKRFSATGKLYVPKGGGNTLIGFFNSGTINEWRTPNSLVMRINGRGETFHAHLEYTTSRWRAGAGIIGRYDAETDRNHPIELAGDMVYEWSLDYLPKDVRGSGAILLMVGPHRASAFVDAGHRADGAKFDRFGILNVIKSFDGAGELWLSELTVNDKPVDLSSDPGWVGSGNRREYETTGVRPRFDFGYSKTNFAGGAASGEIGGTIYRGDCRYPDKLAYYGDAVGPLTLDQPLHASGKVTLRRGVSDSTVMIGFFHSEHSMLVNESQQFGTPRDFLGAQIEGPSREGFYFYSIYRTHADQTGGGYPENPPHILPDGSAHAWSLDYDPSAAAGNGRITVVFDGQTSHFDLPTGHKAGGATFDRFGIVTPWIDGNGQEVFFDDLEYTFR